MTTSSTFRILPEYAFIRRNTGFTASNVDTVEHKQYKIP